MDDEAVEGAEDEGGVLDAAAVDVDGAGPDEGVGAGAVGREALGEEVGQGATAIDAGGGELALTGHGG